VKLICSALRVNGVETFALLAARARRYALRSLRADALEPLAGYAGERRRRSSGCRPAHSAAATAAATAAHAAVSGRRRVTALVARPAALPCRVWPAVGAAERDPPLFGRHELEKILTL